MPNVSRNLSPVSAPSAPATQAVDLRHFAPTGVSLLRDGGTILVKGNLNRSLVADVRLDGAINSPTRGKFFVASHMWNKSSGPEHAMTKAEMKQLKASMTKFLSTVRLDRSTGQAYGTFMQRLDDALGATPAKPAKVTAATTQRLLQSTNRAIAGGHLKWRNGMPLGERMVEVPLFTERHPDGYSYSAMVPVGALAPSAPVSDPNKATSFFIKRTGGFAGSTTYAGPVKVAK